MPDVRNATDAAREELLPLLETLRALTGREGDAEQEAFFERVRAGIARAAEPDDLVGPFMELSTAAFRGFDFTAPVALLLDRVLAVAQTFSYTLSAPSGEPH